MPARHHILIILAFWVATMGWLFFRDLKPLMTRGEPPPFTIDLADEASAKVVAWTVLKKAPPKKARAKDGRVLERYQNRGYANTWVKYREADDTFEVSGQFKLWSGDRKDQKPDQVVESMYRVSRAGELQEIRANVTASLFGFEVVGHVKGEVKDRLFNPHFEISSKDSGINLSRDLSPVEVSAHGSVLNPLQPLNRLPKLRMAQHWTMPLVDPLADALTAAVHRQAVPVRYLDVEVLPQILTLPELILDNALYPRRGGIPCLVIDYAGDDISARTWVRELDGLVFRQEVTQQGDTLILDRD
jgi:hypothetical protein